MSEEITKAQPSAEFNGDWLLREVRFNAQGAVVDWRLPAQPAPAPQPAAPVVSDEQIKETIDCIDWSQMVTADDYMYMIARAILALRPAVEPMTPEQRDAAIDAKLAEYGYPANTRNAARAGWYACLQALGITAKAEGGV